jgi:hypothetical protein
MGSGPVSDRANGEGPSSRRLILRLRSPLARPVGGEGRPSCVLPVPPARPAAARMRPPSPWQRPARPLLVHQCLAIRLCSLSHRLHQSLAQLPLHSAYACARGLNQSHTLNLTFAPVLHWAAVPERLPQSLSLPSAAYIAPVSLRACSLQAACCYTPAAITAVPAVCWLPARRSGGGAGEAGEWLSVTRGSRWPKGDQIAQH